MLCENAGKYDNPNIDLDILFKYYKSFVGERIWITWRVEPCGVPSFLDKLVERLKGGTTSSNVRQGWAGRQNTKQIEIQMKILIQIQIKILIWIQKYE